MDFANEKVAVLYGGDSAEREVSLSSGKAVANGLSKAGMNVELIDTKGFELSTLNAMGISRVFIALHGRGGEDGRIQGALDYLNIPYTGSGVLGSALSMDKARCKQIWQSMGLPTAPFIRVYQDEYSPKNAKDILAQLNGKVMVKPCHEGSSIGMAIAEDEESLDQALVAAFAYDDQVLVEQWINGAEYTVSILGEEALPAIRMETPRSFYDYEAKYKSTTTQYHCPCGLSAPKELELQTLALKAFKATNASGWGRVDFMLNQQDQWQILEVNTVPGMTETSLVPKAARVAGYNFEELVVEILKSSIGKK